MIAEIEENIQAAVVIESCANMSHKQRKPVRVGWVEAARSIGKQENKELLLIELDSSDNTEAEPE